ncbi:LytR C-terminal domain-containing protein [Serinibacter salmoneus]|uniref:LytR cell envelope-related transcriptional attenuator n=1 Tax=Serinibacter salmoneus TaxID=556530 RepID=A0A2A9D2Q2_9MICO|nr:LytR C-terminal domain-containing protein [Serinibacter salmoneus]PFG20525.1 LytR cell envelope-related transcriptional attenuator [Serinibacter salmoneus]
MASDDYPYPEDEFDRRGRERSPQAVHRAPRPWWAVWWPLIAVVIAAPVLAIVLVNIATNGGDSSASTTTSQESVATESAEGEATEGTDDAEAEQGEQTDGEAGEGEATEAETTAEPTEEETTEPEVTLDFALPVRVLNGSGVAGAAGASQEQLVAAGWTNVTAGNYESAQPQVSTVFYANAEMLEEAEAIAAELGIGPVSELTSITDIAVVLRADTVG